MHPTIYEIAVRKQREMFEELLALLRDNKMLYITYVVNVIDDEGERRTLLSNTTAEGFTLRKGSVDFIEILTINVSANACPNYGWSEDAMAFYFDIALEGKPKRVFVSPLAIASIYIADADYKGWCYGMGHFADVAVIDRVHDAGEAPDVHTRYYVSKMDKTSTDPSSSDMSLVTSSPNVVAFSSKKH